MTTRRFSYAFDIATIILGMAALFSYLAEQMPVALAYFLLAALSNVISFFLKARAENQERQTQEGWKNV